MKWMDKVLDASTNDHTRAINELVLVVHRLERENAELRFAFNDFVEKYKNHVAHPNVLVEIP